MELYEIKNGLTKAHLLMTEFYQSIDIEAYRREIEGLTVITLQEGFWDDANKAKVTYDKLNKMKKTTDQYDLLETTLTSLDETYELVKNTEDQEFKEILESDYTVFEKELSKFETMMLLSGEHDDLNAIVEIHPGAGGTESQDWAEIDGDVAGIKSVTMLIKGDNVYGHLKAEKGVHRLVRLSPFDSAKRRHTSFASVDVMPEFNNEIEIEIQSTDLKIDTYRASGAGGQHINKTDSAVRITHLPTNIVVTCQSQRSQIQNREQAMVMLKSKLYQLMLEKQASELKELKGEQKEIAWGSQIRSYVLHPYSLVKDNRSGYESNNPKAVLDGDLDGFIYAYLKSAL